MLSTIRTIARAVQHRRRVNRMLDEWAADFVREVDQWHRAGHPMSVPPVVVEAVDGGLA